MAARVSLLVSCPGFRHQVVRHLLGAFGYERLLTVTGYDREQWGRRSQVSAWTILLKELALGDLDALEVSPGLRSLWAGRGWRSYEAVQWPAFDLCHQTTGRSYDIIIADNVFEHLRYPYRAGQNVLDMLRPAGRFLMATPFLVRVHGSPNDYTRWTPQGLLAFLEDCGFSDVTVDAWGNRRCVRASFLEWPAYGWRRDMRNEPQFPITVWAYARKS